MTESQARCLVAIARLSRRGIIPTYDKIRERCGRNSVSNTWKHIANLKGLGYVEKGRRIKITPLGRDAIDLIDGEPVCGQCGRKL